MKEWNWATPEHWKWNTLGDVAKWASGGTPRASEPKYYGGGIPWLVIGDLNDGVVNSSAKTITELGLEESSAKYAEPGSIMVAMYGSIGKLGIAGIRCTTNQAIAFTREISEGVEPKYLFHYLAAVRDLLLSEGKGGAQANISQTVLKQIPFCYPLREEQRLIATKLDRIAAHLDDTRVHLDTIPAILKRFRLSVFAAACSGRLTEDWRKMGMQRDANALLMRIKESRLVAAHCETERRKIEEFYTSFPALPGSEVNLPNSWVACFIGSIGQVCNGSTPSRKEQSYWGGNIPWVSSGEVQNCIIETTRECITQAGYDNCSVRLLPKGSVLIAMIGEGKTRGQSAILQLEACINQNIAAIVIDHGMIEPKYLWYWFQGQYGSTREAGSGSGPKALNCQRVRELPFNLPPIEEQIEIVRRVDALLIQADTIESRYCKARIFADKLMPAVLAKAFRGELV